MMNYSFPSFVLYYELGAQIAVSLSTSQLFLSYYGFFYLRPAHAGK